MEYCLLVDLRHPPLLNDESVRFDVVVGDNGCRESVQNIVRDSEAFLEVTDLDESDDGTKHFLLDDLHLGGRRGTGKSAISHVSEGDAHPLRVIGVEGSAAVCSGEESSDFESFVRYGPSCASSAVGSIRPRVRL